MVIDTAKRSVQTKFRFLIFAFSVLLILFAILIIDMDLLSDNPIPFSIGGLAILLIYVYIHLKKYNYLYFSHQGGKIIFRYYNLIPTTLNHHSIEFAARDLVRYELSTDFTGVREDLVLLCRTRSGIAKYPPVSISGFSGAERDQVLSELGAILEANAS